MGRDSLPLLGISTRLLVAPADRWPSDPWMALGRVPCSRTRNGLDRHGSQSAYSAPWARIELPRITHRPRPFGAPTLETSVTPHPNSREVTKVRKVQVVLQDDLDGGEPAQTGQFSLDGKAYEIDLSEQNAATLRDTLAPWIAAARRPSPGHIPSPRSKPRASSDTVDIRRWAKENDIPVSDRGRISLRPAHTVRGGPLTGRSGRSLDRGTPAGHRSPAQRVLCHARRGPLSPAGVAAPDAPSGAADRTTRGFPTRSWRVQPGHPSEPVGRGVDGAESRLGRPPRLWH